MLFQNFLKVYHNITISTSSLKHHLCAHGHRRVRNEMNEQEVKNITTPESKQHQGVDLSAPLIRIQFAHAETPICTDC